MSSTADVDQWGTLPAGWDLVKMAYVVQIPTGLVDPRTDRFDTLRLIAPNHIESGTGRLISSETAWEQGASSGKFLVRAGDIIYSKIRPALNKATIAPEDCLCSADMYPIRPNSDLLDSRYLMYAMLSSPFLQRAVDESMRVAMPKVNRESLGRIRIPVPPLATQKSIASFLDRETAKIDRLVEQKQRLLELLDEKRTALVGKAIGSTVIPSVKLGYLIDILSGFPFPSGDFSLDSSDIRLLRGINLTPTGTRWEDIAYWPSDRASEFSRYHLEKGDIVFGMDRPWIGSGVRVARINENDLPALLLQRVARIRAKAPLRQDYLHLILQSPQFRAYFQPILSGVSVPHISAQQIQEFRISVPSLSDQDDAVYLIDGFARAAASLNRGLQKSIEGLRRYRTSLISSATMGRIDLYTLA